MEKISLTVEKWVALQEQSPEGTGQIPVWFQVTGGSMQPFVRPFRDQVMIVAVQFVHHSERQQQHGAQWQ